MRDFPHTRYYLHKLGQGTQRFDTEFLDPRHRQLEEALAKLMQSKDFCTAGIGELCHVFRGKTAKEYVDAGPAIIKVRNVTGRGIDWETEFVEQGFFNENEDLHLKKDDIVLTSTGDGTIGRADIFDGEREAMPDGHVTILRVKEAYRIEPIFLPYYLQSVYGQTQIERGITGSTGQTELTEPNIRAIQVVFPKTSERQVECVSKAHEGITNARRSETQIDQELVKIEELLQKALNFELTTAPRRFYSFKLTQSSERMDLEFNDPFYSEYEKRTNGSLYPWIELDKLVTFSNETKNPLGTPNEQFLYVDIGNIDSRWGTMSPEPMMGYEAKSARMRRLMHEGAVLVSTTRPTRKAIAIVPEELDGEICSTGFAVLKCNDKVNSKYLFHVLRTDFMKHQFERFSSGSGYPEINKEKDLPRIKVPCPKSIDTQIEIVKRIEAEVQKAKEIYEQATESWRKAIDDFENALVT